MGIAIGVAALVVVGAILALLIDWVIVVGAGAGLLAAGGVAAGVYAIARFIQFRSSEEQRREADRAAAEHHHARQLVQSEEERAREREGRARERADAERLVAALHDDRVEVRLSAILGLPAIWDHAAADLLAAQVRHWAAPRDGTDVVGADVRTALVVLGRLGTAPNLGGLYLRDVVLKDADFSDATFARANLADAVLSGTSFANADLTGADLRRASLAGADLRGADLSDAMLPAPGRWLERVLADDRTTWPREFGDLG